MIATFTLCSERAFPDVLEDPYLSAASLPQKSFSNAKVKLARLRFKEVRGPVVSAALLHRQIGGSIL